MTRRTKSILKYVLLCLFVAWIGFLFAVNRAMHQPPEQFGHFMSKLPMPAYFVIPFETLWSRARKGTINVGDQVPDFNLPTQDKTGYVRLSSFHGQKPVVLVFGSYTWPPFRREVPALNKLYEKYGNDVAFYAVYILEAHPSDVWQMQSNVKDNVVFASPRSFDERVNVANSCVRKLGIKFPAVIDGLENTTEKAYTGWPDRLFLIDRDGRLVYKSKPGPFGFHPEELEHALEGMKLRASR